MSFITLHGPIFWEKNLVYTTILKSRKARLYPEFFWKHFCLKWSLAFFSISMFTYFFKKSWIFKASYYESNIVMTFQGFNKHSQMLCNVTLPTESNFAIRSRYFFILSSLTFKAYAMFVTFLLFQSNLYVVLARGKGPRSCIIDIFARQIPPGPQLRFKCLMVHGKAFSLTHFPKCLKNVTFSKFLVNILHFYKITELKSFTKNFC